MRNFFSHKFSDPSLDGKLTDGREVKKMRLYSMNSPLPIISDGALRCAD